MSSIHTSSSDRAIYTSMYRARARELLYEKYRARIFLDGKQELLDIDANTPAVLHSRTGSKATLNGANMHPQSATCRTTVVAQTACPSHTDQTNGPPWYSEDGERGRAQIGGVSTEGGRTGAGGTRPSSMERTIMFFCRSRTSISCTLNAVEIECSRAYSR